MMTMMSSTPPPMYIASSYVGFIRSIPRDGRARYL